jgi:hypothetical protein
VSLSYEKIEDIMAFFDCIISSLSRSFFFFFATVTFLNHQQHLLTELSFHSHPHFSGLKNTQAITMFTKTILLSAGLAALALAEPIPQGAPTSTYSYDPAAISSELASLSSLEAITSIFSDLPTLPSSIESVLATAVPTSVLTETNPCAYVTDAPQWYNSLPASVKSALTSYESALVSWSKEHSAALASLTTGNPATGVPAYVCTNTGAAVVGGTTAATAKNTGTPTAGAGSTGSGSAAGSSSSKAAAPRATGAVAAGLAGAFGVLGLMAAL